jgi:hypothetical protein
MQVLFILVSYVKADHNCKKTKTVLFLRGVREGTKTIPVYHNSVDFDETLVNMFKWATAENVTLVELNPAIAKQWSAEKPAHFVFLTDGDAHDKNGSHATFLRLIRERPFPEVNRVTIVVCNDRPEDADWMRGLCRLPMVAIVHVTDVKHIKWRSISLDGIRRPALWKRVLGIK